MAVVALYQTLKTNIKIHFFFSNQTVWDIELSYKIES